MYECQVSTQPVRSFFVRLNILGKSLRVHWRYKFQLFDAVKYFIADESPSKLYDEESFYSLQGEEEGRKFVEFIQKNKTVDSLFIYVTKFLTPQLLWLK